MGNLPRLTLLAHASAATAAASAAEADHREFDTTRHGAVTTMRQAGHP